ncbi:hypothetical protein Nepgr_025683 [Nepenthes gracilis]|uniref:RRM domain-containing protein n=1 Tax=Nepenthes gracilis TaxID=150966 RepID=A0AAD3T5I7_NEPGR|nr:hypothetical protein Nepgr_025683 [Nepenthes gracilis]
MAEAMELNVLGAPHESPEEEMEEREDGEQQKDNLPASPDSQLESESESDSDSDSDDEEQDKLQLQTLESELSFNPSNYDSHVQYIKLLRKMGDIEKLRKARESMSQLFPLNPSMWQEWAKDETSLSSGPEAVAAIEMLYERGVSDYLSVCLWCDYLNFIEEYDPSVRQCSVAGISKARSLFERAVTAAGLHFSEGSKIWEAYKEFEQAIFHAIDECDIEAKEKQVQRIRSIFHRQLSVPLADMLSNLLAYKAWEVEQGNSLDADSLDTNGIVSHVAAAYQKALDMYNARVSMEEQISSRDLSDSDRLPLFMRYLKFEESSGDPARVQILYERAVTDFPISSDLWLGYARYLDKTLKVGNVVKDFYTRATRNCPWIGELWVRYLLSLERACGTEEEISGVFEKALQCTFSSYEEYLDLFLTRIDGLRRRIELSGETQVLDYAVIRDTFQRASDYLSTNLKGTDDLLRLHVYWARLAISLGKDIVAARSVWDSFLKISGSMLEAWKSYIAMEIENGNINEARSIYRRCYTKRFAGSGSEDICHSWLRFEREFGMLEDYDYAVQKVSPRLEELRLFRLQQESKNIAASAEQRENPTKKNVHGKRKPGSELIDDQSPVKRQKNLGKPLKKGMKKDADKGQNLAETNTREEIEGKNNRSNRTHDKLVEESTNEKRRYTDLCTAFVSNISLQANYEHLRNFFSDVGGVVSIRILHDKFTGKSRGLAYVDFSDDAHLAAAVAKNKQGLLGKKLSIARSDPTHSNKRGSVGRGKRAAWGDQSSSLEGADSEDLSKGTSNRPLSSTAKNREDDSIELKGKNTFAAPRNIKPLGWSVNKPGTVGEEDGKPKSNEEFRKMFLKS